MRATISEIAISLVLILQAKSDARTGYPWVTFLFLPSNACGIRDGCFDKHGLIDTNIPNRSFSTNRARCPSDKHPMPSLEIASFLLVLSVVSFCHLRTLSESLRSSSVDLHKAIRQMLHCRNPIQEDAGRPLEDLPDHQLGPHGWKSAQTDMPDELLCLH